MSVFEFSNDVNLRDIFFIGLISFLTYKYYKVFRLLEKLNVNLIDYYLHKKFINKLLNHLLEFRSSISLKKIIYEIKNYYFLESITLFKEENNACTYIYNDCFNSSSVTENIKYNWLTIKEELNNTTSTLIGHNQYLIKHNEVYILLIFKAQLTLDPLDLSSLKEEILKIILLAT